MAVTVPAGTYPYEYNITCRRGDTFSLEFIFTGLDFTDNTFKCEVRDMYDKRRILEFVPILTDTNHVHLDKSATQMNVRAGRYLYDLASIDDESTDTDRLKGVFTIQDDVSANVDNPLEDDDSEPLIVG